MPWVRSNDGAEIHYHMHGSGPVNLMFLHGWGGGANDWDGVATRLDGRQYRSLCPDLRGHGQSSRPRHGYTWVAFEQDVLAVADQEEAGRFITVGFSAGGKLACYMGARHADRIAAQMLVAPVGPGIAPVSREVGLRVCRAAGDWEQNRSTFRSWFGAAAENTVVDAFSVTLSKIPEFILEATAEMVLWTSLIPSLGRLDLPTMVARGDNDPVYGDAYQREHVLPFLHRADTVAIHSGHFIPLENPIALAGLISTFVKGS